jgi:indolepyruvate ferredoxin oxidoreductase
VPALVRGYGHVKQANAVKAADERTRLLDRLKRDGRPPMLHAAE